MKRNVTSLFNDNKKFICKYKRVNKKFMQIILANNIFRGVGHIGHVNSIKVRSASCPELTSFILYIHGYDKKKDNQKIKIEYSLFKKSKHYLN